MTVVVEFSLPAEAFPFGRATSGASGVRVQLERVVPLGQRRVPFLWVTDPGRHPDFETFERHLRDSGIVERVEALARTGGSVLYAVEWRETTETFLNGLSDAGGTLVEAHGDSEWSFVVRFQDHGDLTRFHQFYQAHDYPVHIDRIYAPDEESCEFGFGLTPEQRETLLLAVEGGYFSVPRETNLEEIAEELGVTRQAASERVRRGTETVLRKSLIGLTAGIFAPADEGSSTAE